MLYELKGIKTEGYLTGQLLIALPQLQDSRFNRAVIFVCGHDEQGAMGIVLNKVIDTLPFEELLKQLNIRTPKNLPKVPIYYGGPVEMGRGFVLHTPDFMSELSVKVTDEFVLSATLDIIEAIARGKGPRCKLLALGYAGWSPGQLEAELVANNWLHVKADSQLVFQVSREELWRETLDKIGIDPKHLSLGAGHA
jgi:putative transcriptional regulator